MGALRRTNPRRRRAGFSLVELLLAALFVAVAGQRIVASFASAMKLSATARERALAIEAAESALEEMRGLPLLEVFARFDADPENDPGGAATAPGAGFEVLGLTPRAGDQDGRCGRIEFPSDGFALREDSEDAGLGMPRDLNADGAIDDLDHSTDYVLLPVRVVVEWDGAGGEGRLELVTTLAGL